MTDIDVAYLFKQEEIDPDDDLFANPPPRRGAPQTARITCRVCDKPAEVPILASGLLCEHCRRDLDVTERHIRDVLDAAQHTAGETWDRFSADYAHADEAVQSRYDLAWAACGTPGWSEKWIRQQQFDTPLGNLARRRAAFDQASAALERLKMWADTAFEEMRAARET